MEYIDKLNDDGVSVRLSALRKLADGKTNKSGDVNNHIHTWYSFSPYSPAKAVYEAKRAGLDTAGIMDHDSVAGLGEFRKAGEIAGLPVTCGAEVRVSFAGTPFANRRINHPDQSGAVYAALHAVPARGEAAIKKALIPVAAARDMRNREMAARLNRITGDIGISLDYDGDILPLSKKPEGGSVTERHILFALAKKLTNHFGRGEGVIGALENKLKLPVSEKNKEWLRDSGSPNYDYDLLGALKGELVERFYVDAMVPELFKLDEYISLANEAGCIAAYAYLGDVGSSVTGDKKAQLFEDSYLDELIKFIKGVGFHAVTYMPSRNTHPQLARLKTLCERYGLFQISGEDINSPRQKFICEAARAPEFANLNDAAWALIGSERMAEKDLGAAMFSPSNAREFKNLNARIAFYCSIVK